MRSETGLHRRGERVGRTWCLEGVFQKKSSGEASLEVKFSEKEVKGLCGRGDRRGLMRVPSVDRELCLLVPSTAQHRRWGWSAGAQEMFVDEKMNE